jgi:hypothetical protein
MPNRRPASGGARGANASSFVFDDDAMCGLEPLRAGRVKEQVRRGLGPFYHICQIDMPLDQRPNTRGAELDLKVLLDLALDLD